MPSVSIDKQANLFSKVNNKKSTSLLNDRERNYNVDHPIINLQKTIGNQAVQRLLSQSISNEMSVKQKKISDGFTDQTVRDSFRNSPVLVNILNIPEAAKETPPATLAEKPIETTKETTPASAVGEITAEAAKEIPSIEVEPARKTTELETKKFRTSPESDSGIPKSCHVD